MIKRYYSSYTGKQIDEAVKTIVENQIGLEDLSPELVKEIQGWISTEGEAAGSKIEELADVVSSNTLAIEALEEQKVSDVQDASGKSLKGEDGIIHLPTATAVELGLVRGSTEENGISIDSEGKMSVNSLNVNKLVQTSQDELILNGGNAAAIA